LVQPVEKRAVVVTSRTDSDEISRFEQDFPTKKGTDRRVKVSAPEVEDFFNRLG
jgi:hypothetical protein